MEITEVKELNALRSLLYFVKFGDVKIDDSIHFGGSKILHDLFVKLDAELLKKGLPLLNNVGLDKYPEAAERIDQFFKAINALTASNEVKRELKEYMVYPFINPEP